MGRGKEVNMARIRRYRNIPGQGLTHGAADFDIYPPYDEFDIFARRRGGRTGIIRRLSPELRALRSKQMRYAWELFRSGKVKSMAEAMRIARRQYPG
jgi:hypothetical protein